MFFWLLDVQGFSLQQVRGEEPKQYLFDIHNKLTMVNTQLPHSTQDFILEEPEGHRYFIALYHRKDVIGLNEHDPALQLARRAGFHPASSTGSLFLTAVRTNIFSSRNLIPKGTMSSEPRHWMVFAFLFTQ